MELMMNVGAQIVDFGADTYDLAPDLVETLPDPSLLAAKVLTHVRHGGCHAVDMADQCLVLPNQLTNHGGELGD
jgi:hypothetical protein